MRASTMLASMAFLLPLALASPLIPRDDTQDIEIIALSASLPVIGVYGTGPRDAPISITVEYPDSSSTSGDGNLTTKCSYLWLAADGPGPIDWTPCDDPALQWRLPEAAWVSPANYVIELYLASTANDGTGLDASHQLKMDPAQTGDPNAYLSCLQMGKFQPSTCTLNGPLSSQPGPVIMDVQKVAMRPT